jgi:hypothetical protein
MRAGSKARQKSLITKWRVPLDTPVWVRQKDGSLLASATRSMPWMKWRVAKIDVAGMGCCRIDQLFLRRTQCPCGDMTIEDPGHTHVETCPWRDPEYVPPGGMW